MKVVVFVCVPSCMVWPSHIISAIYCLHLLTVTMPMHSIPRQMLLLVQTNVSARVDHEVRMTLMNEAQMGMLEQVGQQI